VSPGGDTTRRRDTWNGGPDVGHVFQEVDVSRRNTTSSEFQPVSGIATPEPRIMVTVLGLTPDDVRVVDARRSRSEQDIVRVELGDVHIAGDLRTIALVLERASVGLVEIEGARKGGEL
jgi:hypothetical protein